MNSQFGPLLPTNVFPSGHSFASMGQSTSPFGGFTPLGDACCEGNTKGDGVGVYSAVIKGFRSFGMLEEPKKEEMRSVPAVTKRITITNPKNHVSFFRSSSIKIESGNNNQ